MSAFEKNIEVQKVWFTKLEIFLETISGVKLSHPLSWFPKLNTASKEQLRDFEHSSLRIH